MIYTLFRSLQERIYKFIITNMQKDTHNESQHPQHASKPNSAASQANSSQPSSSLPQKFARYWSIISQKLSQDPTVTPQLLSSRKTQLQHSMNDPQSDRALGAIFGATIGDALGAYCQFQHYLSQQTVNEAMQMNGGGTFNLAAGQFTDDSQLASHLLHALCSSFDQTHPLSPQQTKITCSIALQYLKWYNSDPFDIGHTTSIGISGINNYHGQLKQVTRMPAEDDSPDWLENMFEKTYKRTSNSQANGSLMRISPFALFFAGIGEQPLEHSQLIKNEIRLTHPNTCLGLAGLSWVSTLTSLILRPNSTPQTFTKILTQSLKDPTFAQSQLQSWHQQSLLPLEQAMPGVPNMGHAKIAYSYGFRILRFLAEGEEKESDESLYKKWIRWVISQAGDTDTNAAIVGGMLGSIVGFWQLPERYVVRSLKTVTDGRTVNIEDKEEQPKIAGNKKYGSPKRPSFYQPCNVLVNALALMPRLRRYRNKFHK